MYKNREVERKYKHEYYVRHKDKWLSWEAGEERKQYRKDRYRRIKSQDPEGVNERSKEWKQNNPDKVRETLRSWRIRHPNYFKEYYQKRKFEPDVILKRRLQKYKRKILCKGMFCKSKFTKEFLSAILIKLENQKYRCIYCGVNIRDNYTIDHIIPISNGGVNEVSNMELLCSHCNSSKGKKSKEEFIKYLEGRIQTTAKDARHNLSPQ